MPCVSLPETCFGCPAWDEKVSGHMGYCGITGRKTIRGHACDAPPLEAFERRRWEANAPDVIAIPEPKSTVFTCYGR